MSDTENQKPATQDSKKPQTPQGKQPRGPIQLGLFNLVVTVGLLVFGAISVTNSLGEYLHPGEVVNQMLASLHTQYAKFPVITYTPTPLTSIVGSALLTLQGANFGLITWWAVSRLRAGKPAFWIPVLGAFFSNMLTFIALLVLLLSDPTIMKAFVDFAQASGN